MAASVATAWTFFPLWPVVDGVCTCSEGASCNRAGKHPSIAWGDLAPGTQIAGPEGAGRGLVTGAKSGVFVLDVDVSKGKDGFAELDKLGPLPPTYTVDTPTGGRHFYFAHPGRRVLTSGCALGPGLDIRGDGGFVVGPGSRHANGGTYLVSDSSPIAQAPDWLLAWPGLYGVERAEGGTGPRTIGPTHKLWAERNMMADAACRTYAPSQGGGDASAHLGRVAKRLVWDLELPADVALEKIATLWDPRCTKEDGFTPWPWGAAEIERVIANTMTRDYVSGVAPAGWLASFEAELSKPTPARPSTRRVSRRAEHQYECKVGDVPNGDKTATTFANVVSILASHESWNGVLQYDTLKNQIRAVEPPIKLEAETSGWADHDTDGIVLWFETVGGFAITKDLADRAIASVARTHTYNPVQEWILSLPPEDPYQVFEGLASKLFGTPANSPEARLYDTYLRKFCMAAVRRAFGPGEKVDNVLVLQSPNQGAKKSQFVEALFGFDWSIEDIPEQQLGHKDNALALASTWGVELAELDKLLRAQNDNSVKNFLTRRVDTYRPPYGRHMINKPRQCVFVGTTNETDFLRDPSGSRRYWCVPISEGFVIPYSWVRANRARIWSAAYQAALTTNGTVLKPQGEYFEQEQHWLTSAEELLRIEDAEQFTLEDMTEDPVIEACKGKTEVRLADVVRAVRISEPTVTMRSVIATLKRLGARKSIVGGSRDRVWTVPERISTMTPNAKKGPWP